MYIGYREKGTSCVLLLLQVDVFSRAGVFQVFLVVLLEGSTAEKKRRKKTDMGTGVAS